VVQKLGLVNAKERWPREALAAFAETIQEGDAEVEPTNAL
jgi:hypothetical protein